MPGWLPKLLRRVRHSASGTRLRLTGKAAREAAALGLAPDDVRDAVHGLKPADSVGRILSLTGEWMYVFKPRVDGRQVYVKLVLRDVCIVVSFHEDEVPGHEEDE